MPVISVLLDDVTSHIDQNTSRLPSCYLPSWFSGRDMRRPYFVHIVRRLLNKTCVLTKMLQFGGGIFRWVMLPFFVQTWSRLSTINASTCTAGKRWLVLSSTIIPYRHQPQRAFVGSANQSWSNVAVQNRLNVLHYLRGGTMTS